MSKVTVVDYGAGNLLNVVRALEHCSAEVEVTRDAISIQKAEKLVLPGVGAFGDCMSALAKLGVIDALKTYIHSGKLFLGICVGMQILFEVGEEFGEHEGLGIIKGRVVRIPDKGNDGKSHKIPHIGWNALKYPPGIASWKGTLLAPLESVSEPACYFVHSYMGVPANPTDRLADVNYNGIAICAAVKHGNAYGMQFHPEKSGPLGLEILQSFLALL